LAYPLAARFLAFFNEKEQNGYLGERAFSNCWKKNLRTINHPSFGCIVRPWVSLNRADP